VEVAKRFAARAGRALRKLPQEDATAALKGLLDFTLAQTSATGVPLHIGRPFENVQGDA
jgi:hypothetical protein